MCLKRAGDNIKSRVEPENKITEHKRRHHIGNGAELIEPRAKNCQQIVIVVSGQDFHNSRDREELGTESEQ